MCVYIYIYIYIYTYIYLNIHGKVETYYHNWFRHRKRWMTQISVTSKAYQHRKQSLCLCHLPDILHH